MTDVTVPWEMLYPRWVGVADLEERRLMSEISRHGIVGLKGGGSSNKPLFDSVPHQVSGLFHFQFFHNICSMIFNGAYAYA